ncbi:MAG: hypothetical protein K1X91_17155 [Bacteriodetes bacterium]|nr:hypothetical protein [Bacteroidota bacterium]
MKRLWILILISNNLFGQINTMENKYENLDRFSKTIHTLNDSIGKKYGISEYAFDVECIYQIGDLTKLVKEMIGLGGFEYKLVKEGQDNSKSQYYTVFEIANTKYEFRTSSEGDYVDLETVMPSLELIAKNNKPDYQYNFSNADGGQIAFLIFAKTSELQKAVDEGYPCSLQSGQWRWDKEWKWGVYSDIKVESVPDFEELKVKYFQTLTELYALGFNVPNLTINRIYIDDIFQKKSVDIVIDGGPMTTSSNEILGNQIRCFWESWGVLLAYTLVKHYNGQPSLYDKEEMKRIELTQKEYLEKAEVAFGKRK